MFVAVSINIDRILAGEGLPDRALSTVLTLLMAVCVSIVGLIPGQGNVALGAELLGLTALLGIVIGRLTVRSLPADRRQSAGLSAGYLWWRSPWFPYSLERSA